MKLHVSGFLHHPVLFSPRVQAFAEIPVALCIQPVVGSKTEAFTDEGKFPSLPAEKLRGAPHDKAQRNRDFQSILPAARLFPLANLLPHLLSSPFFSFESTAPLSISLTKPQSLPLPFVPGLTLCPKPEPHLTGQSSVLGLLAPRQTLAQSPHCLLSLRRPLLPCYRVPADGR